MYSFRLYAILSKTAKKVLLWPRFQCNCSPHVPVATLGHYVIHTLASADLFPFSSYGEAKQVEKNLNVRKKMWFLWTCNSLRETNMLRPKAGPIEELKYHLILLEAQQNTAIEHTNNRIHKCSTVRLAHTSWAVPSNLHCSNKDHTSLGQFKVAAMHSKVLK